MWNRVDSFGGSFAVLVGKASKSCPKCPIKGKSYGGVMDFISIKSRYGEIVKRVE